MNLFLMRHADAIYDAGLLDKERPLSKKGQLEAVQTANFLQTHLIDFAIISSVKRALDTYKIIANHLIIGNIHISDNLYKKHESYIVNEIKAFGTNMKNLLIIGHNPSISLFSSKFIDKFNSFVLKNNNLSTASVVVVNFVNISHWSDFDISNEGQIKEVFVPKIWDELENF